MHRLDMASLLSTIIGVAALASDAAFQGQIKDLFGVHAPQITAALGMVGLIASQVLRVIGSPSSIAPPAQEDAPATAPLPQAPMEHAPPAPSLIYPPRSLP